jgi:hypothetical protein
VIYEMLLPHPKLEAQDAELQPAEALRAVATRAEAMATTLWFATESDMTNLIVCGQATLCFNLLKYLQENRADELSDQASPVAALYQRVKERWLALQQDERAFLQRQRV